MQGHGRRVIRTWLLPGLFLFGVAMAGTALAQQPMAPSASPPQRGTLLTPEDRAGMVQIFLHRMQERLGLTDQQVTDIHALLDAQRTATRADVQSLIAARRQLRSLLDQPTADAAAIQTAATQVKMLQGKLFDQRLQNQLAIRAILTPDQLMKWTELRKSMGHRGMQRGHGFGPGRL